MQVNSASGGSGGPNMLGVIVHGCAFLFTLLHIWWTWWISPFKCADACKDAPTIEEEWWTYLSILAIFIFIGGVVVNIGMKNVKLASILGIVGGAFVVIYTLMYLITDEGKAIRDLKQVDILGIKGPEVRFTFNIGRICAWLSALTGIGAIAVPAFVGGGLKGGAGNAI